MKRGIRIVEKEIKGEKVFIRSLDGGDHTGEIIELLSQVGVKPSLMTRLGALLMLCCECDAEGNLINEGVEVDEIRKSCSLGFLKDFTEAAIEVAGLDDDADAIRKNLQADQ